MEWPVTMIPSRSLMVRGCEESFPLTRPGMVKYGRIPRKPRGIVTVPGGVRRSSYALMADPPIMKRRPKSARISDLHHMKRGKRIVRSIGFASLILMSSVIAQADESLVLNLPAFPNQHPAAESAPALQREAAPIVPRPNPASLVKPKQSNTVDRRGNPRKAADQSIGRLGMASKSTSIYARQSSRSRSLSSVPAGTYLALTREAENWYGILMADRSTGWMKKSTVKLLDFEVVSNQPIGSPESGQAPAMNGGQQNILQTAYFYLGVPYKYGGTSDQAMDCSAFVKKCFQAVGISLPRTSREQINVGMPIDPAQLQPCDRLYFANRQGTITHTGIYIGDGYFIHASSSRGGVAVSRLNEPMYRRMFAGARR